MLVLHVNPHREVVHLRVALDVEKMPVCVKEA